MGRDWIKRRKISEAYLNTLVPFERLKGGIKMRD